MRSAAVDSSAPWGGGGQSAGPGVRLLRWWLGRLIAQAGSDHHSLFLEMWEAGGAWFADVAENYGIMHRQHKQDGFVAPNCIFDEPFSEYLLSQLVNQYGLSGTALDLTSGMLVVFVYQRGLQGRCRQMLMAMRCRTYFSPVWCTRMACCTFLNRAVVFRLTCSCDAQHRYQPDKRSYLFRCRQRWRCRLLAHNCGPR